VLTDPNNVQRFGKPPDVTTRLTLPAPAIPSGAGETGFDATGSIAKQRKTKRKPGSTFPLSSAAAVNASAPYGAPQQSTGQTSAPQVAARNAYANIYKPPDAPVRRPLPRNIDPYEPLGVRAGEFLLRPSIEAGYGFDTNPNRTPSGPRSAFWQVSPEVLAKSEWSRHEVGATLRGSYISYDKSAVDDRPAADTKVYGRFDATRDLRFEGEGRFLLGTDNPGSPNLQAGLAKLPIFTIWGFTTGVAQRFNRLDLSLKGSIDRTEYADSELTDGSTVSNQDRNYYQYKVQGRASYELTPGLKPFVEIEADRRDHDPGDSVDRSSSGLTPKAGMTFEWIRYLTGEISVGYLTRDYVSPEFQTLRGWVLDASLIWVATGLTTVKFAATTRADETTLAGSPGTLRHDVGLQVDHAFRRWLVGTIRVGFGQDNYVGVDRIDNRTSLAAIITYKINREIWLKGEYRREWMNSTAPNVDYTADIFLAGIKLQR
jgi:hypothetical protein